MLTTRVYYQLNSPTESAFPRSVLHPPHLSKSRRQVLQFTRLLACRLCPNATATNPQMRLSPQVAFVLLGLPVALLAAPVPASLLLILKRRSPLLMMLDSHRVSPLHSSSSSRQFQKQTVFFKLGCSEILTQGMSVVVLDTPDEQNTRRSKRTIVPPLQYWKNERIDYERRKSGKIHQMLLCCSTK